MSAAPLAQTVTRPIRLLLADDHALLRSGVAGVLGQLPDLEVVAEANDGDDAIAMYDRYAPDVALLDLKMPGTDGVTAVEEIRRRHPDARIIILTTYDTDDDIARALRAGAMAYLLKDVAPRELVACVRAVHVGQRWVSSTVGSRLAERINRVELTPREMGVLRLLAEGLSNKQIGTRLGIVEGTAKVHVSRLFEKLGVASRTEAVAAALKRGLVRLS